MTNNEQTKIQLTELASTAKDASEILAVTSTATKNKALTAMAEQILAEEKVILAANAMDLENAVKNQLSTALQDRLKLTKERIKAMAKGLLAIAELADPCTRVLAEWDVPSGLHIKRVATPLGVIGVIYESRPNVTADAAALCLKAGNAVILRGGSDAYHSNHAILSALHQGLIAAGLPKTCIQMVPTQDRDAVGILLSLDEYIDVIVPRGGKSLIKRITEQSRIPLFKHLQGLCHTYIHQDAELNKAVSVTVNAKMRRPGICGATETILVDENIIKSHLQPIINELISKGCEIRGDENTKAIDERVKAATDNDWGTEYLDAIVTIKIVADIDQAIKHIKTYGSNHTDAIITEDNTAAEKFFKEINSAIVMHNCSTQFADGGEFGMGAEIGIATGKLHARGPVGVEQLTTFKYVVEGTGQIRV